MIGRVVGLAALAAAFVVVVVLLSRGGDTYEVTAEFANAGQLVKGNEVVVGGAAAGKVETVELGPQGQALVTFTVNEEYAPLARGTVATIRSPSLSQIAGRQVELTLPVDSQDPIDDGGTLSQQETVSAVDLDQLFNTLDPETVEDFKHVIQGFEESSEGVGPQANRGLKYLNPFLSTSRRVFGELNADGPVLERLIVDSSQLSGALAERAPDISALVANLSATMNAIGDRKEQLAEAISLLPDFLRRANTTFVNLRAALDDLDPLVTASKPAVAELRPFLAELRATASAAVPTVRDLDAIVRQPGSNNDLVELTRLQPAIAARAIGSGSPNCGPGAENPDDLKVAADGDFKQGAFGETVCALTNSLGTLSFFRAYTPELMGWFNTFSHIGGVDGTGGLARIGLTLSPFSPSVPIVPDPANLLTPEQALAGLNTDDLSRCPGRNERPVGSGDDSVPFSDGGALTDGSRANGECDPSQGAVGP